MSNGVVERGFGDTSPAAEGTGDEVLSVGGLPCIRVFTTSNGKVVTQPADVTLSMISTLVGDLRARIHLFLPCHLPIALQARKVEPQ